MLTNEEFRIKQEEKQDKERDKHLKPLCECNFSKPRMEKQLLLDAIEKERLNVIVPVDTEEKFYRSNYKTICTSEGIKIRCRNFKEYYCINSIELQKLRERELQQMLEHYSAYMESTRKGYLLFIRNYVVVDESLLYELIDHISTTPQQAYKKRTQWKRLKAEVVINSTNLFQELEQMTPRQKDHIKQMHEYNCKIYS